MRRHAEFLCTQEYWWPEVRNISQEHSIGLVSKVQVRSLLLLHMIQLLKRNNTESYRAIRKLVVSGNQNK